MSSINRNARSSGRRTLWDEEELTTIKVEIKRRHVIEPISTGPLIRTLDDPASLIIHFNPDEGLRPVFEHRNVLVNQYPINDEDSVFNEAVHPSRSRSSSSSDTSLIGQEGRKPRNQSSPTFRNHKKDYYSSRNGRNNPDSPKTVYKISSARSPSGVSRGRSPRYHRTRDSGSPNRRRSKSPYSKTNRGRSPSKYDGRGRRRSKSPPPRRGSRDRRGYSPYHRRSRSSRSPYRRSRYSRSPRRSPSSRTSYSSNRRHEERPYELSRSGNPHYKNPPEFWIPGPMLPGFIPNRMMPPVGFPYAFPPGIPPMVPAPMPIRPQIVYNSHRTTNNNNIRCSVPTSTPKSVATIAKLPETKAVSTTENKNVEVNVSKST